MAGTTNIGWADATWNPISGCTRVSSGCARCYAFALHDRRYAANREAATNLLREVGQLDLLAKGHPAAARSHGFKLPFPAQYDVPFSKVQLLPDRLDAPLRWKKPRQIFVNSMSDLFHGDVPDEFILEVWLVMAMAQQHKFLILTKRPERMRELLGRQWMPEMLAERHKLFADDFWPLPNVWLGVSVEDQATADERIPLLLRTPAAVRFVSAEPLLEAVDLGQYLQLSYTAHFNEEPVSVSVQADLGEVARAAGKRLDWTGLDWLIVGGETGKGWRPMNLDWPRALRDQCVAAGVPYFYKQGNAIQPGKHRELDGRTWEEMPC